MQMRRAGYASPSKRSQAELVPTVDARMRQLVGDGDNVEALMTVEALVASYEGVELYRFLLEDQPEAYRVKLDEVEDMLARCQRALSVTEGEEGIVLAVTVSEPLISLFSL